MRWFKHMTMAHTDAALSALLEDLGAEAYGVWWLILEDIAGPMEKKTMTPIAIHSDVKWSQICYCSARKFRSIANRLHEKSLIVCTSTDNRLQIEVPNLLKFRDEYSKKSGHSPDSRSDTDTEVDTDTEEVPFAPSAKPLEAGEPSVTPVAISPTVLSPVAGTLPLVGDKHWQFTEADLAGWHEAYPAVDVVQQLREMRQWCLSNPTRRKTQRGIRSFVTTWLSREQNRPHVVPGGKSNGYSNGVNRSIADADAYLEDLRNRAVAEESCDSSAGGSGGGDLRRVC